MIFVTVIEPRGREIYVNGAYKRPQGPTPTVLVLEPGMHIIQTLNDDNLVDFEGTVPDTPDLGSATVDLTAVIPPKPKDT
jgi:hypothetical protein